MNELPIIQKTYDLIKWYVPILNNVPKDHKLILGQRIINNLYDLLESLVKARYMKGNKSQYLQDLNLKIDIIRYQTRLLFDFSLISQKRYEYVNKQINSIGIELGGWIKQQKKL